MNKFILLKKYTSEVLFWPNLIRKKQITELTVEEVLSKYNGFEGDLISQFSVESINESNIKKIDITDKILLYLGSRKNQMPSILRPLFVKVGYDFGTCEEDQTVYSSIFNEILFGSLEMLISWKNRLNENYLFETEVIVNEYASQHRQLLMEVKDVEDDENMKIHEIWKYNFN